MVEKDYTNINARTPTRAFSAKLASVVLKYGEAHKPYDEPCARLEFRDILDRAERESERRNGFVNMEDMNINIDDFDFEKYGNSKRFEQLEDQKDVQDKVIEGTRTQVLIGHTISYRCTQRGHKISVFIPIKEYNEMIEEKK